MSVLLLLPVGREGISLRMDHFQPLFSRIETAFEGLFSFLISAILALLAYKDFCPSAPIGQKSADFP